MFKLIENVKNSRTTLAREYAQVNANPVTKAIIQTLVMLVDIAILCLLVWNIFNYFIPTGSWINVVDGDSMYPTMHSGQILFSDTSDTICRGDIVTSKTPKYAVAQHPEYDGMVIVKRVIGVPGDRIIIDETGVYVNDSLVNEPYLTSGAKSATYLPNSCNSVKLGVGEYFLMGDNRSVSYDSRAFGVVEAKDIMYKQSETPTTGFYLKLILVVLIFALDIFLYALVEFILTGCAYAILYRKKCDK